MAERFSNPAIGHIFGNPKPNMGNLMRLTSNATAPLPGFCLET